jgi:hypothetical protein
LNEVANLADVEEILNNFSELAYKIKKPHWNFKAPYDGLNTHLK